MIDKLTDFCLWVISKTNKHKNKCLSQRLFELAENYNTRPGTFYYYQAPNEQSQSHFEKHQNPLPKV